MNEPNLEIKMSLDHLADLEFVDTMNKDGYPEMNTSTELLSPIQNDEASSIPLKIIINNPIKKRSLKSYEVFIPSLSASSKMLKSTPRSAVSTTLRQHIKSLPLHEEVKVYAKSKVKTHNFSVLRNYDNVKHRRFILKKINNQNSIADKENVNP